MPEYTTDDIRNVALVGHGGAGKTTLAEALLAYAGVIGAPGSVANGTSVCDFDPQEKAHQHSLYPSVVHFDHGSRHVNLVDTPGYPDFLGRALPVLAAVETAAVVVDARQGVQMVTRRMMEAAAQRGLARMVVVNRIDADDLDPEALLASLVEAFGAECMPINLPADGGRSVVDCFFEPGDGPVDFSSVEEAHTRIVDQVVEVDEELMELYLEQGEELEADRLHDAFERALREGHLIPVCFTSAETGAGVAEFAAVIEKVMPSPPEANRPPFRDGRGRAGGDRARPWRGGPRPRLQGLHRRLRGQARGVPDPPRHSDEGLPAPHRRRAQAGEGRPSVRAAGQGSRRDRGGGPRRHLRGGEDRRGGLRRGDACVPGRRGPRAGRTGPARADAGPRHLGEDQGGRAEARGFASRSSRPRTPASPSSTTRSSTRRSSAVSATCTFAWFWRR